MTSATATAVETGVLFPLVDGRRSTQSTARAVFADATRSCAPDVADAIDLSEKPWPSSASVRWIHSLSSTS